MNNAYTYPNTASNVHAYIIDTGIRFTHNDFGGRASGGLDAIDGGSADDCHGHGRAQLFRAPAPRRRLSPASTG